MKGHIVVKENINYAAFYTCNGRCCEITDLNKVEPEINQCCEVMLFPIKLEQQNIVEPHDHIEFTLAEDVTTIINNSIGVYAEITKIE
jgi:hypothetical protein